MLAYKTYGQGSGALTALLSGILERAADLGSVLAHFRHGSFSWSRHTSGLNIDTSVAVLSQWVCAHVHTWLDDVKLAKLLQTGLTKPRASVSIWFLKENQLKQEDKL